MITIPISFALCFVCGLILYGVLTPRNATIATYLIFYLTLPPVLLNLPGVPDLAKTSVIAMTCWLGTILFASDRLLSFQPRWVDIAVLLYMFSPFPTALSNDLTYYDGLSGILGYFLQHGGSPYLLGRIHFRTTKDIRALAIAIFIGGLAYVLPCLFEIRMSPIIRGIVYGIGAGYTFRMGGFRPTVFLSHGLELGMWMTATCTVGYTLWLSRSVRRLHGFSMSWLLVGLFAVTVLCRSTGALFLLMVGVAVIYLTRRIPAQAWLLALVLFPPIFEAARIADLVSIDGLTRLIAENLENDRAQSLQFRFDNENMYINKAIQRPIFGWGGYNRHQVYDKYGNIATINDSRWIIAFSITGLFGLGSWNAFMIMPAYMLASKASARDWLLPELAPTLAITLVIALFSLDNLVNDMDNPIYSLGAGAVVSVMGVYRATTRNGAGAITKRGGLFQSSPPSPETEIEHRLQLGRLESRLDEAANDPTRWADLARGHESFARCLAARGQIADAEEVWNRAIHLWDDLAARCPSEPTVLLHASEARNDLAWMLASRSETTSEDASRAMALAQDAIRVVPESIVFRNTLAMAFHQMGAWSSVLQILGDAHGPAAGPPLTSHNNLLLALAHHHLGNPDQARAWHDRARTTMNRRTDPPEVRQLADKVNQLLVGVPTARIALPDPNTIRKSTTTQPIDPSG